MSDGTHRVEEAAVAAHYAEQTPIHKVAQAIVGARQIITNARLSGLQSAAWNDAADEWLDTNGRDWIRECRSKPDGPAT